MTRPIDRYVGERLRAIRERRGLSLQDLSDRMGIDVARLTAYEAGERIKPESLAAIARSLHVLIAEFFVVIKPHEAPRKQPVDELTDFPPLETERLLGVWRRLDEAAQRKALRLVQMVAGE
jgi:transcriptional regulator with XRE-family HTH domain